MKAIQITVIKGTQVLGTVLRATVAPDEELIMQVMQGNEDDTKGLVIEPGCTINVGTQWYFWDTTGFQNITGSADWNTNTAWFYDVTVFNSAMAQGMEFRDFNKETKLQSYVQTEQQAATEPSQDATTGETGAKNVGDIKKQTKEKTKKRLFGKKHGKTKEKVTQEADDDVDFCAKGIMVFLDILRKNNMGHLADRYQDLLYSDDATPKSLRELAVEINAEVYEMIKFHEKFVKDKNAMDIVTLKSMFDENGNEVHRSILDMLLDLLIWTYDQLQGFCKQWSKGNVFLPFRIIMGTIKVILDVVRTIVGAAFYIVNGIVCLVSAALWKLETFIFGVIAHFKDKFANWNKVKDEPAVEQPAPRVAPAPAQ